MDGNSWLDIVHTLSGFATPIVVAVLGVLLLRRIESVKAEITRQSAFHVMWADEFFEACKIFLQCLERETAILVFLAGRRDGNDEDGLRMQHELGIVHLQAYEMKCRIRRLSLSAPETGEAIVESSEKVFNIVHALMADRHGNLDRIFEAMNTFNQLTRKTHSEMLSLDRAKA